MNKRETARVQGFLDEVTSLVHGAKAKKLGMRALRDRLEDLEHSMSGFVDECGETKQGEAA
jgi:hypothetical protein